MSSGRMITGVLISLAAAFAGCTIGLAVGGYGICAVSFSLSLVGFSATIGALFAGAIALVWRQVWWAGALAFSVPTFLGASFAASGAEWQRVVAIGICIAASVLAAFVVRYPGPSRLRRSR